jgi:hypothetical protein
VLAAAAYLAFARRRRVAPATSAGDEPVLDTVSSGTKGNS